MGMAIIRKAKQGFTLIELMIVVAIIGVLAVLAVFGVRRYITNAKSAEARNTMGGISQGGVIAYEMERTDSTGATTKGLCVGMPLRCLLPSPNLERRLPQGCGPAIPPRAGRALGSSWTRLSITSTITH